MSDQILDMDNVANQNITAASFGRRLGAIILDGLIIGIPLQLLNSSVFGVETGTSLNGGLATIGTTTLISTVVQWLYFALMESSEGQATLGKKILKIKVTDEEGQRISFLKATGRHFGKMISGLILLIGYFMMLFNDKSQTLHDKMASCLVIENK
ncbi:MAG: RDD family protein [Cyclobacteriaceae bacterium]